MFIAKDAEVDAQRLEAELATTKAQLDALQNICTAQESERSLKDKGTGSARLWNLSSRKCGPSLLQRKKIRNAERKSRLKRIRQGGRKKRMS